MLWRTKLTLMVPHVSARLGHHKGKPDKENAQYKLLNHTNSEVNISHETTTMVVWIYDGI